MKYMDFVASNAAEEFAVLVGRVEAFAVLVNASKYSIDREMCAKILGFALDDEKEPFEKEDEM